MAGLEINFSQKELDSIADAEVRAFESQIIRAGLLNHLLPQRGGGGLALEKHPGSEIAGINDDIKSPHPAKYEDFALNGDIGPGYSNAYQPQHQTLSHRLFGSFDQPLLANGIEKLPIFSHELRCK
jgi:hypothetical protein